MTVLNAGNTKEEEWPVPRLTRTQHTTALRAGITTETIITTATEPILRIQATEGAGILLPGQILSTQQGPPRPLIHPTTTSKQQVVVRPPFRMFLVT